MKNFLFGVLGSGVIAALGALLVIFGGWFPVAAFPPEPPLITRVIHTAYEKAVAHAAEDIIVPDDMAASARTQRGAYNFQAMCAGCHAPPGSEAGVQVQVQGMNPRPPELTELASRRSSAEAFWVIKNGVRMTGMPAFGPTHEDEELWALVAFLAAAQDMTAGEYAAAITAARTAFAPGDGHGHSHGAAAAMPEAGHPHPGDGDHDNGDEEASAGRHEARVPEAEHHHPPENQPDHHDPAPHPHAAATHGPEAISDQLYQALVTGEPDRVRALLDDEVLIFESGGVESDFAEYAAHHLSADMAFLKPLQQTVLERKVFEQGDQAVVASRSSLRGTYKDKNVDLVSTETLLLQRQDGAWRIKHIHWSSGDAH
jgi:mono/diheme cytochrome c family protein/ketosteroid isomerase-like protein